MSAVAGIFLLACGLVAWQPAAQGDAQAPPAAAGTPPRFEVDPAWPAPLPNDWVLGPVSGIGIDAQNHVVVVQRTESDSIKKAGRVPAPPIVEFDAAGRIVRTWGGPGTGCAWMEQVHE